MITRLPKPDEEQASEIPAFPFLTLLVSGGHNMMVLSHALGRHTILGSTLDDSIGEAFDKTARLLDIKNIPGGPHLERMAAQGDHTAHDLPKPMSKSKDRALREGRDYSFAGLKSAVRQRIEKVLPVDKVPTMDEAYVSKTRADIAASFQHVAVEHLMQRVERAIDRGCELEAEAKHLVVAGGVAANKLVRTNIEQVAARKGLKMVCPPIRLCMDNGIMVAWTGHERLREGLFEPPPASRDKEDVERFVEVRPRWPLGKRDDQCAQHKGKQPSAKRVREEQDSRREGKKLKAEKAAAKSS